MKNIWFVIGFISMVTTAQIAAFPGKSGQIQDNNVASIDQKLEALADSIAPDTKVYLKKPELIYSGNNNKLNEIERKKMMAQLDGDRRTGLGC